jgi:hypothetical protein
MDYSVRYDESGHDPDTRSHTMDPPRSGDQGNAAAPSHSSTIRPPRSQETATRSSTVQLPRSRDKDATAATRSSTIDTESTVDRRHDAGCDLATQSSTIRRDPPQSQIKDDRVIDDGLSPREPRIKLPRPQDADTVRPSTIYPPRSGNRDNDGAKRTSTFPYHLTPSSSVNPPRSRERGATATTQPSADHSPRFHHDSVVLCYMSRPVSYQDRLKRNCYRSFHPES